MSKTLKCLLKDCLKTNSNQLSFLGHITYKKVSAFFIQNCNDKTILLKH